MSASESASGAARRQLDRVLTSPGFSRNERLTRFLRYIVDRRLENQDSQIKESVLAFEVFGRAADHDPKQDSIVRTEAARLRARLSEYYRGPGKYDPLVIEIPKGGYIPEFRFLEPGSGAAPNDAPADIFVGRQRETGRLLEHFQRMLGGSGKLIFLAGEAGIGKSALAEEFLRQAPRRQPELMLARGRAVEQFGAGEAYLPFMDALSGLLRDCGRAARMALRTHAPTWCLQLSVFNSGGELEELRRETAGATKDRMLREMGDALGALARQTAVKRPTRKALSSRPSGAVASTTSTEKSASSRSAASANGNVQNASRSLASAASASAREEWGGSSTFGTSQHHKPLTLSYPSATRAAPSGDSSGDVLTPASDGRCHSPHMSRYMVATRSGNVTGVRWPSSSNLTGRQSRCASITTPCLVSGNTDGRMPSLRRLTRTGTPQSKSFPDIINKSRNASAVAGKLPASTMSSGVVLRARSPISAAVSSRVNNRSSSAPSRSLAS